MILPRYASISLSFFFGMGICTLCIGYKMSIISFYFTLFYFTGWSQIGEYLEPQEALDS